MDTVALSPINAALKSIPSDSPLGFYYKNVRAAIENLRTVLALHMIAVDRIRVAYLARISGKLPDSNTIPKYASICRDGELAIRKILLDITTGLKGIAKRSTSDSEKALHKLQAEEYAAFVADIDKVNKEYKFYVSP